MKQTLVATLIAIACATQLFAQEPNKRLRVIMTSDFPPIGVVKGGDVPNTMKSDPDDMQSMVRFLLYANEFDIEGLVASAGTFAMEAHKKNILGVLDEYEKVVGNLKKHDPKFPTADYLRSVTYEGKGNNNGIEIKWGRDKQPYTDIIGEGKDSEASDAIIAAADKDDPRPIWIGVWGGPREVAQALWKVKNTRSEAELKNFVSKLRVFLIAYQDASHGWMMDEFPELFVIDSRKTYQGMFGGRDEKSNLAWVNEHIRNGHGPLCDIYPHEGMGCTGVCEGDSPTFMHLLSANRGINDPEDPTQPSWGGQYKRKEGTNHYVDGPGRSSISKWRADFQKEFQERANWCVTAPKDSEATSDKPQAYNHKPRVIHTTDLGADPDDEQSLVRQLVSANEFDIEGLIVATGCWKKTQSSTAMLDKLVDAYGKVEKNLSVHADGFPTYEYLKSISIMGQKGYGMSDVGDGKDSPGSELIIASADKDDPRPLWVTGWGGMNTIAQAIWKARATKSPEDFKKFLSKLRLFDILGQDDAGAWIARNFPDLFYIRATGVYGWQPPKNGSYQKDDIQSHGPLGALYPDTKWATEGDTPAFMHMFPNGLNDPDEIDQGSWGGRFSFTKKAGIRSMSGVTRIRKDGETRFDPYLMYGNTPDKAKAIKRWSKGYDNDFAARMDWSITSKYEDANHQPIAIVDGDKTRKVLEKKVAPGSSIELSAAGSSDPDGDALTYTWSFYEAPSSYDGAVTIENNGSQTAKVTIPEDAAGKDIHIILEVHDDGEPNLYAYRRVIFTAQGTPEAKTDQEEAEPAPPKPAEKMSVSFSGWLKNYIPSKYPEAKLTDHTHWMQAHLPGGVIANWAEWPQKDVSLKECESHGLKEGESLFISKSQKEDWPESDNVVYYDVAGYYINKYVSATMSEWMVEGSTIIQFDGEQPKPFTEQMAKDWKANTKLQAKATSNLSKWLKDYLPATYPDSTFEDHGAWFQTHIGDLVVSWAQWNDEGLTLKTLEAHAMKDGRSLFVSKAKKEAWEGAGVTYYEGAGYYIASYTSATMSGWGAEGSTIIQFDGDSKEFAEKLARDWNAAAKPASAKPAEKKSATFSGWLKNYIPSKYPEAKLTDHTHWMQAHLPDGVVANWADWPQKNVNLEECESHGLKEGESLFISKSEKEDWPESDNVVYYDGVGYYIDKYASATMSAWVVEGSTIIQFDGDQPKPFTEQMAKDRKVADPGTKNETADVTLNSWLKSYIPKKYADATLEDHGGWAQAKLPGEVVVSWAQWNEEDVTLKALEAHALKDGRAIFISKDKKEKWAEGPNVVYHEGTGYYIAEYASTTMSGWGIENSTVIQYDGDAQKFTEQLAKDWPASK